MTVSPSKARKLARSLLRENRKNGRSWRVIAHEDYHDAINYATLNRIALSKGAWLPKDETILMALGLITPRRPHSKDLFDWTDDELRCALLNRQPMPRPTCTKKAMNDFIRACKRTSLQRAGTTS